MCGRFYYTFHSHSNNVLCLEKSVHIYVFISASLIRSQLQHFELPLARAQNRDKGSAYFFFHCTTRIKILCKSCFVLARKRKHQELLLPRGQWTSIKYINSNREMILASGLQFLPPANDKREDAHFCFFCHFSDCFYFF